MENQDASCPVAMPAVEKTLQQQLPLVLISQPLPTDEKQKHNDPLFNVIQKLTALVKEEKSSKCLDGKKRSYPGDLTQGSPLPGTFSTPPKEMDAVHYNPKRSKDTQMNHSSDDFQSLLTGNRKVMFYQCSICKFTSPSFEVLTAHVKSHGQQNEIILMCSECRLTFRNHDQLESHIKKHCEAAGTIPSQFKELAQPDKQMQVCTDLPEPERKKWYAYEGCNLYRCLICSYTCGQQRMLKTHAWKHAGEVDCSYPIFEEENESAGLPDSTIAHTPQGSESVLSEDTESKTPLEIADCNTVQVQGTSLDGPMQVQNVPNQTLAQMTEVVVLDDALLDADQENVITDSLLSSAQQIISCSQNKNGHVNVIVERLPGTEEAGLQKPFLMNSEPEAKKKEVPHVSPLPCEDSTAVYHADKDLVESEEIVVGWSNKVGEYQGANENSPPVRRRTNSECLRLHSLAAEALVTMPIRIVECPKSNLRIFSEPDSVDPDTGQQELHTDCSKSLKVDSSTAPEKCNGFGPDLLKHEDIKVESELTEEPMRMGISMSLLKVIEKLRERTDQDASDEDILKELQDNEQSESASDLGPNSNLVEYLPHLGRPYRCCLCHYTSDNKGYIKQHLRVHRQRQPYQCPICDHIADNSNDLENHMINHCKTKMYECKNCGEAFYSKSQLRTHEIGHRSLPDIHTLPLSSDEAQVCNDVAEEKPSSEESKSCTTKLYRCDVCTYTSSTYVGVRNHRRIHTSDKPYRCSLCGYVCSHPPSLKSHMWKHASDQNYNYEQVNKAINEAMSQSSRYIDPPKIPQEDCGTKIEADSGILASQSTTETAGHVDDSKVDPAHIAPCDTEKLQSQVRPEPELCVLLFCCCICGFESTSKELLMEHMKAHEGEIINIILNKTESPSS
ncbi:zinc finger protein 507 [Pelodytes ibericus]